MTKKCKICRAKEIDNMITTNTMSMQESNNNNCQKKKTKAEIKEQMPFFSFFEQIPFVSLL